MNCLYGYRMLEDILTVKEDSSFLKIKDPQVQLNFEKPGYPSGRCANLGPGIRNMNKTAEFTWFILESNFAINENVEVFFQDPINGAQLLPTDFEMEGDAVEVQIKPYGNLRKFKTRISKFQHVKGDPKFDCENYDENRTYNDCIENELVTKFHELIGCHPPLISKKKEKICNKTFSLSRQDQSVLQLIDLLQNLVDDFDSNSCKKSCTRYVFETRKIYDTNSKKYNNSIKIVFDKNSVLTRTNFLLGVPSLLTGVGGAISGGRTLMWFIISSFGIIKIIQKLKIM